LRSKKPKVCSTWKSRLSVVLLVPCLLFACAGDPRFRRPLPPVPDVHPEVPPLRGEVRGRLRWETLQSNEKRPVVVYLESRGADRMSRAEDASVSIALWAADAAAPEVVGVGERVRFRNQDPIYHKIFSTSEPNDFQLEAPPATSSGIHRFESPGVVRLYCALHEQESAVIIVSPTAHYSVVDPSGHFVLRDVEPGRYRLTAWGEGLVPLPVELVVGPGDATEVELPVTLSRRQDLRLARGTRIR